MKNSVWDENCTEHVNSQLDTTEGKSSQLENISVGII